MEQAIQILNRLEREGILSRYAIGGAVAALFHAEPVLTYDLDVFVILPSTSAGLITLEPLYARLRELEFTVQQEHVMIHGVPVQFLPAYNPLIEEALAQASEVMYGATPTRAFTAEYLAAIMMQTGRDKDRQRFREFMNKAAIDQGKLLDVVTRFQLLPRWHEWNA